MDIFNVDFSIISVIRKEFGKNEIDIKSDVEKLKEWILKKPHLPQKQDEIWLERILVRNKFRMEQTKTKLENYYTLKWTYKELFCHMDMSSPQMKQNLENFCWIPLKTLTKDYHRVFYCKLISKKPEDFDILPVMTRLFATLEISLVQDYCAGDIILADGIGSSFYHLLKFEPNIMSKIVTIYTKAYSGRFGGAHIINALQSIDILMKVLKAVLPETMYSKIKVHKSVETLYDYIPKECLPSDLGGYDKPVKQLHEEWVAVLKAKSTWLKQVANTTSDESLRVGETPKSEMFGSDGSFRKLNID